MSKIFRSRQLQQPEHSTRIADWLPAIGTLGALIAAFAWASAYVRDEAFFKFFGARASFMGITHEQMVFSGGLEQFGNLLWTAAAAWISIVVWRYRTELGIPRAMDALGLEAWFLTPLAVLVVLVGAVYALKALAAAEQNGNRRARALAIQAEAGTAWKTFVVKGIGDKRIVIEGYQLGCTEKSCILYRPGVEKTADESTTAMGSTIHVPLDSAVCLISARGNGGAAADCDGGK